MKNERECPMMRNGIDYRRVFTITSIASLIGIYIFLWSNWITTPKQYLSSDFVGIYAAGRTAANEGAAHVYDLTLQHRYQSDLFGFEIPPDQLFLFAHPPFAIILAQIVATNYFIPSFILWDLLMMILFFIGTIPLMKLFGRFSLSGSQSITLFAGILLFFPVFECLIIGQDSAVLFLGLCIWMHGILTGKDRQAGLGLSLAAIRPHIALLLAVPFLFKRRKVWWWFVVGCAGLGLFSLAYAGIEGVVGFLRILFVSGGGNGYQLNEVNMVNSIALFMRIFPFVPVEYIRVAGWVIYIIVLTGICILWFRSKEIGERQLGTAVLLSVFAAPHLHFHDLAALIVPMLGLMIILAKEKYRDMRDIILLPLAISIVLLSHLSTNWVVNGIHYLMEFFLLFGLIYPHKLKNQTVVMPQT